MSSPSSFANPVWYVYGIVPANVPRSALPGGLDGAAVLLEEFGDVAALVSVLDGARYDAGAMEANSGDLEWLSPRAVSHDLVLTSASDAGAGAVVPLPMFSLFSGRDAVRKMLGERASQLAPALLQVSKGREFALRVYRVDGELLSAVTSLSPRLAAMAQSAANASAGQRYLLERKLAAEKKAEVRSLSQQIVDEIVTQLSADALL
ncbi:MAG: GvpL/GvpF family gas vesicle protein, partial [Gemmatimonadaceae bacterium]